MNFYIQLAMLLELIQLLVLVHRVKTNILTIQEIDYEIFTSFRCTAAIVWIVIARRMFHAIGWALPLIFTLNNTSRFIMMIGAGYSIRLLFLMQASWRQQKKTKRTSKQAALNPAHAAENDTSARVNHCTVTASSSM